MSGLKHVSTFSGVGGIDLAFERAGVPTVATAEFDKHARGVIADRNPETHQFHDVKEVTADALYGLGLDPRRTVLSGGFPCQDLSLAGARRGMGEGTRSGLYWELDRIMGEFRPAWVVFENVPGLLSAACACPGDGTCVERDLARQCVGGTHAVPGGACWGECIARHGGVMGAVLGSMAERGYGFAYRVLDAQHFGVPQRRRRVIIVGHLGDSGAAPAQVLLEPEGVPRNPAQGITPRKVTTGSPRAGFDEGGTVGALTAHHGRLDDNQATQLVVGVLGDKAHTLTAEGHDAGEDGTGRGTPIIAFDHKAGGEGDALREDQSPTLTSGRDGMAVTYSPEVAATITAGISRPGVSAPGSRQEDDVNVTAFHHQQDPISSDQSPAIGSKSSGMGVAYVADTASTLQAVGGDRGYRVDAEGASGGHLVATQGPTVRRLTPTECERLQGFPDGHTSTSNGKPQSDSQRYKQMGNAVAVPVFEWVARRLVAVDAAEVGS